MSELCPGGLMDKVAVSGTVDAGSIPARDARSRGSSRTTAFVCFCVALTKYAVDFTIVNNI